MVNNLYVAAILNENVLLNWYHILSYYLYISVFIFCILKKSRYSLHPPKMSPSVRKKIEDNVLFSGKHGMMMYIHSES